MILTVTPNPAIDMTFTVTGLDVGESHRVDAAQVRAGGKGINVARVAHQLGYETVALAPTGGLTGRDFERQLTASGVPHRLVPVAADTRRSITIVDSMHDTTTVLNERGGPLASAEWAALATATLELVGRAHCLVGSGSLPPDAPDTAYAELVGMAHRHGIPAVIDTTGPALLLAARAEADIVKPNRRELAETTGEDDPVIGATHLLGLGAGLVLVSLGEAGMLAVTADDPTRPLRASLPEPLTGNPTGAGDAAVAAIAATLATGSRDPLEILLRATAWSAAAVLMPLASEISPSYPEIESRLLIDRL